MEFQEPHVLLIRGNIETKLEEAIKNFTIPLERISSKRGMTTKYFAFAQANGGFLLTISKQENVTNPNIILAVASPSERTNLAIKELFEQQTETILDAEFPRQVLKYSKKELAYNFITLQRNRNVGKALLKGDLTREYIEAWKKYRLN